MPDCNRCGFPNPASMGVVVCRNCGTRLLVASDDDSERPPTNQQRLPGLSSLWTRWIARPVAWVMSPAGMALAIRPVAWVSSLSGLALTSIVRNDVCGTGIAHLMWFLIGPVALISMLVLVVRSPMLWERLAGIVVIVLGAVPNLIIMAGIMLGGLATC